MLRSPVSVTGAGRTDAGVHAREMYAHFDSQLLPEDKRRLILSINRLLGKDIVVYDIFEVTPDAHARFDAIERTYKYFISFDKTPFLYPFCWHSPSDLDIDKMNQAANSLLEVTDFTSFAKLHSDVKTNICDVRHAHWNLIRSGADDKRESPGFIFPAFIGNGAVFTITADRFLRNMVRAVVGTLIDVGRGKLSVDGFKEIISMKDRCSAGISMPANGLFLWEIKYPYL